MEIVRFNLKPDDNNVVSEKMQQEIATYIEDTFFPAILAHIKADDPKLFKIPIEYVSLKKFFKHIKQLKSPFVKAHCQYILKLKVVLGMPDPFFVRSLGKNLIGVAIHISKAMGNQEVEDGLRNIVKERFVPNEDPDLTPWNFYWMDKYEMKCV